MSAATMVVCVTNSISTKKQVKKTKKKVILNKLNQINEVLTIRTIWVHVKSILQGRVRLLSITGLLEESLL